MIQITGPSMSQPTFIQIAMASNGSGLLQKLLGAGTALVGLGIVLVAVGIGTVGSVCAKAVDAEPIIFQPLEYS